MLVKDNAETTTGTIVNPDGSVANRPTVLLTQEEAELLRTLQQFCRNVGCVRLYIVNRAGTASARTAVRLS